MLLQLVVPLFLVAVWLICPGSVARAGARFKVASPRIATVVVVVGLMCATIAQSGQRDQQSAWVVYGIGEAVVVLWCLYAARKVPAFGLIGLGTFLNYAVIIANKGMPVPLAHAAPDQFLHHVTTSTDRLVWLSDVLVMHGSWLGGWYSIGDVTVLLGILAVIVALARPDKRTVPTLQEHMDRYYPAAESG